jgi:peptidoglycan-associated cytoplasmic membrane protein
MILEIKLQILKTNKKIKKKGKGMKAKIRLILGIIICGITSYANELPRQIITDVTELSDIFSEKTLNDTENNMSKLTTQKTMTKIEVLEADETDIINIPKINLKNDDEGHIYVESVTNVPVTVVNEDRDTSNEKRDNDTEKRDTLNKPDKIYINSTKSYLSEDMIKNYYRNIRYGQKSNWNYITKDIEINSKIETVYFTKGTEIKDRHQLSSIYKYFKDNNIKKIKLTGHSDPTGNRKTNAILSVRRADRIRQELINLGISKEYIEIDAKGDKEVIDRQNLLRNRRVEIEYIK